MEGNRANRAIIEDVTSYISGSREENVPIEVIKKAKHHILDSLAAIVSGSRLMPGQKVLEYVRRQNGMQEAQVAASSILTSAITAALANGVMGHADETDDHHSVTTVHPGCSIIPAAMALSEREDASGNDFLKAVITGYEIACRMTAALGPSTPRATNIMGGSFGAAAASAAVVGLTDDQIRYLLSYTAQQASGVPSWVRDEEHYEKAFIFGGMPARNAVSTVFLIQSGFTGVRDPFSGDGNIFEAFSNNAKPELLVEGLGSRYETMLLNIKRYSVGGPIQPALDALFSLSEKHRFASEDVQGITARVPAWGARIVNDRSMPDINFQYILAVALLDGRLTFEAAHSYERMNDPAVLDVKKRIHLVEDHQLNASAARRQCIVEVTLRDGSTFSEHVLHARGTAKNPTTAEEVEKKSKELLVPTLGQDRCRMLIEKIRNLEEVRSMRELRPLLSL